jgi:hypothetical protein
MASDRVESTARPLRPFHSPVRAITAVAMVSPKTAKKHHARLNNPFPRAVPTTAIRDDGDAALRLSFASTSKLAHAHDFPVGTRFCLHWDPSPRRRGSRMVGGGCTHGGGGGGGSGSTWLLGEGGCAHGGGCGCGSESEAIERLGWRRG